MGGQTAADSEELDTCLVNAIHKAETVLNANQNSAPIPAKFTWNWQAGKFCLLAQLTNGGQTTACEDVNGKGAGKDPREVTRFMFRVLGVKPNPVDEECKAAK